MTEITGTVKYYNWGSNGLIRDLCIANGTLTDNNRDKPHAELWIGTHKEGHSVNKATGEKINYYPVLLKVLSITKPLSIQIHPTKETAELLHKINPVLYKDPYDKPEMIIALTKFECLAGFISDNDLANLINIYPFLSAVYDKTVRESFSNIFTIDKEIIHATISKLLSVIDSDHYITNINKHYPADIGILVAMIMNHYVLNKGDALFIEPCLIHSYICGDGIEVMNTSDNVIRGGLTIKEIDVPNLLKFTDCYKAPQFIKYDSNSKDKKTYVSKSNFSVIEICGSDVIKCYGLAITLDKTIIKNDKHAYEYSPGTCLELNGTYIIQGHMFIAMSVTI